MTEFNHLPPQELIDAHDMSRTVHDSDLIKGGAVISNGQLYPNEAQIGEMHEELSGPVDIHKGLGSLALHSSLEADALKSVATMEIESHNRTDLHDKLEAVLNPYIGLYDDVVPAFEKPDKKWYKKDVKPVTSVTVQHSIAKNGIAMEYGSVINYSIGEDRNIPTNIEIDIDTPKDSRPSIAVEYAENGRMSGIGLSIKRAEVPEHMTYLESTLARFAETQFDRTLLTDWTSEDKSFNVSDNQNVTLAFDGLDSDNPTLTVATNRGVVDWKKSLYHRAQYVRPVEETKIVYGFNELKGVFERTAHAGGHDNGSAVLTPEQFAQLLKDTASLIPTTKVR